MGERIRTRGGCKHWAAQMADLEAERDLVAEQSESVKSSIGTIVDPAEIARLKQEAAKLKKELAAAAEAKAKVDELANFFAKKEKVQLAEPLISERLLGCGCVCVTVWL